MKRVDINQSSGLGISLRQEIINTGYNDDSGGYNHDSGGYMWIYNILYNDRSEQIDGWIECRMLEM